MKKNGLLGRIIGACLGIMILALVSCSPRSTQSNLSGIIEIDGSSTVFPVTEAVAEEFRKTHPNVQINVGVSGTGGGFKRFLNRETEISNASRPITSSETQTAAKNGVQYVELRVGIDGLAVVANSQNDFVTCLTTQELRKIWEPGSTVATWNQVRSEWPNQPIKLYGPGTDSGTFDYFTEVINQKAKASRADYTASEDDNVLVQGIAGDRYSLGYFGYAYYAENTGKLKLLGVDSGNGCVRPTAQTIESGQYQPLSRPLFIYVNTTALHRQELMEFVRFYILNASVLTKEVGYVPFSQAIYQAELAKIENALF